VLAAVAATMLVTGSFGFTSVSAERGVAVSITDDDRAYIDYRTVGGTVEEGGSVPLIEIGNLFGTPVELTNVSIDGGSFVVETDAEGETIDSGKYRMITGTVVDCEPGTTKQVEVTVELNGDGVSVQISGETRGFDVRCTQPTETTPTGSVDGAYFRGSGQVHFEATNVDKTNVTYWTTTEKWNDGAANFTPATRNDFNVGDKLQVTGKRNVVAVYFPEYDVTFVHPSYYDGNWKAGDGTEVCGEYDPANGDPGPDEDCNED
jgi:hypothetical protein